MKIDLYILAFSAVTVLVTIWMGFRSAKKSKTASDFFVAGRSVGVGMNASAISGEYLSAASFMGIAGMVMSSGYDALWYPVCYACGYLFLLLFIAGPLRRFGAYTIPDFAEGRFDSPVFRKIAVVFVLFIGFFYTMPQMKGAGTTLAYIFPGLPYWAGVVLVGAVITLNVALGGMKGITLVQAFQYWAKMFAISVPIFVLMAVYGHYGKQVGANAESNGAANPIFQEKLKAAKHYKSAFPADQQTRDLARRVGLRKAVENTLGVEGREVGAMASGDPGILFSLLSHLGGFGEIIVPDSWTNFPVRLPTPTIGTTVIVPRRTAVLAALDALETAGACLIDAGDGYYVVARASERADYERAMWELGWTSKSRSPLPPKAPADATWLNPFGPLTTKAAKNAAAAIGKKAAASAQFENHFEKFALNLKTTSRAEDVAKVWQMERDHGTSPKASAVSALDEARGFVTDGMQSYTFLQTIGSYNEATQLPVFWLRDLTNSWNREQVPFPGFNRRLANADYIALLEAFLKTNGVGVVQTTEGALLVHARDAEKVRRAYESQGLVGVVAVTIGKKDTQGDGKDHGAGLNVPPLLAKDGNVEQTFKKRMTVRDAVYQYAELLHRKPLHSGMPSLDRLDQMLNGRLTVYGLVRSPPLPTNFIEFASASHAISASPEEASGGIYNAGLSLKPVRNSDRTVVMMRTPSGRVRADDSPEVAAKAVADFAESTMCMTRAARAFDLWAALNRLEVELIPVGDEYLVARMREKSVGASSSQSLPPDTSKPAFQPIPLRAGLSPEQRMTVNLDSPTAAQALGVYSELTGRHLTPPNEPLAVRVDDLLGRKLSQLKLVARPPAPDNGVREHGDGAFTAAEVKAAIESQFRTNGLALVAVGQSGLRVEPAASVSSALPNRQATAEKEWLAKHEKPLALLYTYSLIIAIVCGTAGLPHILVRFYTNPDGVAAKKTTMWVMILIGVFYVFPPVFGVIGRNLLPDLYNGVGAKGTDKIVLELPRILNEKYAPLGSILSGITCAGAFAAFMSTFSGLLVSMTGALAHDVYGRILRPKSTPEQRMRMFKIGAVLIGGVAIVLGSFVEPLEINFMVGQAFAIAAASYFPLLFMAVWWRKLTMKGAAIGMLTGGVCALVAAALTNFSNLASDKGPMGKIFSGFAPLNDFWAEHPLLRILCEQPAIWAVPLAITLMIIVSKLTAKTIPGDSRMKMLVLHAPEQLGLKQEYIQEHQPGH